jgi:hypothetical protein
VSSVVTVQPRTLARIVVSLLTPVIPSHVTIMLHASRLMTNSKAQKYFLVIARNPGLGQHAMKQQSFRSLIKVRMTNVLPLLSNDWLHRRLLRSGRRFLSAATVADYGFTCLRRLMSVCWLVVTDDNWNFSAVRSPIELKLGGDLGLVSHYPRLVCTCSGFEILSFVYK